MLALSWHGGLLAVTAVLTAGETNQKQSRGEIFAMIGGWWCRTLNGS